MPIPFVIYIQNNCELVFARCFISPSLVITPWVYQGFSRNRHAFNARCRPLSCMRAAYVRAHYAHSRTRCARACVHARARATSPAVYYAWLRPALGPMRCELASDWWGNTRTCGSVLAERIKSWDICSAGQSIDCLSCSMIQLNAVHFFIKIYIHLGFKKPALYI